MRDMSEKTLFKYFLIIKISIETLGKVYKLLESVSSSLCQRSKSLLFHFILGVSFSSVSCIPLGAWII